MKALLYRRPDGVSVGWPAKEIVQIATGAGYQWNDERLASEIQKMADGPENDGTGLDLATRWITAISQGGLTEVELLNLMDEKDRPKDCSECHQVDPADLPYHITGVCQVEGQGCCFDPNCHDRYFRNAVVFDDGMANKCGIDMAKARVIHMDRIRQKRNEELQKLDISFMIAVERNDKTMMEKITVQKQKLRDIPQTYDLSGFKTPEELKAFWPKEPKELDERIKNVKKGL